MPRLASGTTLARTPIAEIGLAYEEMDPFIWQAVLPPLVRAQKASSQKIWSPKAGMGMPNTDRGKGGAVHRASPEELLDRVYNCQFHGQEYPIDLLEAMDLETELELDSQAEAANFVYRMIMRKIEARVSGLVFNTTTFAPTAGPFAGQTFHEAGPAINNDPAADVNGMIADAHDKVSLSCGALPTDVVMSRKTYFALGQNTQVLARILAVAGSTVAVARDAQGRIILPIDALATYFQVERVHVGKSLFDAGADGGAFTPTEIWDPDFLLFAVIKPGSSSKALQLGRTWVWGQASGPDGEPFINPPYPEENTIAEVVQGFTHVDPQVFTANAGRLYTGIDDAAPGG